MQASIPICKQLPISQFEVESSGKDSRCRWIHTCIDSEPEDACLHTYDGGQSRIKLIGCYAVLWRYEQIGLRVTWRIRWLSRPICQLGRAQPYSVHCGFDTYASRIMNRRHQKSALRLRVEKKTSKHQDQNANRVLLMIRLLLAPAILHLSRRLHKSSNSHTRVATTRTLAHAESQCIRRK